MSSDDDDYMSDKFLSASVKDVRPGLIKDRSKQREVDLAAKKRKLDEEQRTIQKPNQKERLEEGLSNAITADNKGFAMLARMGYKKGEALGKSSTGIVEPIGIKVKADRAGLGRESALKDLWEKQREIRRKRMLEKSGSAEVTTEEFRRRMTQKNEDRLLEGALRKCQRTCEELDKSNNVEKAALPWFWPERKAEDGEGSQTKSDEDDEEVEEEDEDEEVVYETYEKVDLLTCYLRLSYNYCHWCGVHYLDLSDFEDNCPGPFRDDH